MMRCDLLSSPLNTGKKAVVHEIIDRHRRGAPQVARDQWTLFFEIGAFNKQKKYVAGSVIRSAVGSAARVQMLTWQVVGQLQSWVSNRSNEFRDVVESSSLDNHTRHQLHSINHQKAWFTRLPICIHGEDRMIPSSVRHLARKIMHAVMRRHRRPSWGGLPVQLDQREATLNKTRSATHGGRFEYWLQISAAGIGKACVPLCGTALHRDRRGTRALTVQISRNKERSLKFGIVTDVTEAFAQSRSEYESKTKVLSLDFGLKRMFATQQGDMFGQGFISKLMRLDSTLSGIARHVQRSGRKPRDSKRYCAHAERARGFIRTEVNRVLNRLVKSHAPAEISLERLEFRNVQLSSRMNRLLSKCGRSVIKTKLDDLEQRFGIESIEVDPAYTSQRCSSCGHVHKSNRNGDIFRCHRCGLTLHADVNAARNIAQRRSLPALDEAKLRPGDNPTRLGGRWRTLEILRQDFERRHPECFRRRTSGCGPAADSSREPLRFAWDEVRRAA